MTCRRYKKVWSRTSTSVKETQSNLVHDTVLIARLLPVQTSLSIWPLTIKPYPDAWIVWSTKKRRRVCVTSFVSDKPDLAAIIMLWLPERDGLVSESWGQCHTIWQAWHSMPPTGRRDCNQTTTRYLFVRCSLVHIPTFHTFVTLVIPPCSLVKCDLSMEAVCPCETLEPTYQIA